MADIIRWFALSLGVVSSCLTVLSFASGLTLLELRDRITAIEWRGTSPSERTPAESSSPGTKKSSAPTRTVRSKVPGANLSAVTFIRDTIPFPLRLLLVGPAAFFLVFFSLSGLLNNTLGEDAEGAWREITLFVLGVPLTAGTGIYLSMLLVL